MKWSLGTIILVTTLLAGIVNGHAAIIVVDTLEDSAETNGECSLREAIINANQGSVVWSDCGPGGAAGTAIQFDPALSGGTIELNGTQLPDITADVLIEGPGTGADSLIIDGMGLQRIFNVTSAVSFQVQDLTLTGGRTTSSGQPGGAMRVLAGAEANLTRVRLVGNETQGSGGNGGAIAVVGASLSVTDSELSNNQAWGSSAAGGAIFASESTVLIEGSTVVGNRSHSSTGGGIQLRDGSGLSAINSTISGNRSHFGGGGMYVHGSVATLTHSTVAFNLAGSEPFTTGTQGVHVLGTTDDPATLVLANTLVVQSKPNQVTCSAGGAAGSITSSGSLSTHAGCTGAATPLEDLGVLLIANNGGQTRTHALSPDSVAVNAAGDCGADVGLVQDQRGQLRPGSGSGSCDVGAFEVQSDEAETDLAIVKTVAPDTADPGDTVIFTLVASNLGPDEATGVVVFDKLPEGYTFVTSLADTGGYDEVSGQWHIGEMGSGGSFELAVEATVTGVDDYVNVATIAGGQFDPDLDDNTDQAEVTATPHVTDLAIIKEVAPQEAEVGQNVTFTLTASNLGPDPATGVLVLDWLPFGYAYVSSSSDVGSYDSMSGQWTVGALGAGQSAELTIEATVTDIHDYVNSASIDGDQDDPDLSNNTDTAAITLANGAGAIVVNTLLDVVAEDGLCSLREAVINASNQDQSGSTDCDVADVIVFDEALIDGVIELDTQIHINGIDLAILGPVEGDPAGLTLDAGGGSRIFNIVDAAQVYLRDLTLTGGQVSGSAIRGGAVRIFNDAQVEMLRMNITGNSSLDSGGGAIDVNQASLTLIDSELSGNQAMADNGNGGAIVSWQGSVNLQGTTVVGNVAGGHGGGLDLTGSDLTAINSTISGNQSGGNGGGIRVAFESSATLLHGTIAFNQADGHGSGIFVHAATNSPAELVLSNSLMVDNNCLAPSTNASVTSTGSLGTDAGCVDASAPAEQINLLALADNGGPTRTHALGLDSLAVNHAGNCSTDFDIDHDQRGLPRPGASSSACDAGAYEFQGVNQDRVHADRFEGTEH